MSEPESAISRLQTEAVISVREGNPYMAVLSGMNAVARHALPKGEVFIRYFPFRIGRMSPSRSSFMRDPDLLLPDRRPYSVSRQHLSIHRRGDQILLVDRASRYGALVDGELLGEKAGGKAEISLSPGQHQVIIGRQKDPFVFRITIEKDSGSPIDYDYVHHGDRMVSIQTLYHRMCHHAQIILEAEAHNIQKRVRVAGELVASVAAEPDILGRLYFYSAFPEPFSDVIAAHSVNVAIYTLKFTRRLSYPLEEVIRLGTAAFLHDIGMRNVPSDIVTKRGALAESEYETMKRHAQVGHDLLQVTQEQYPLVPLVALQHHERIDGKGYPRGATAFSREAELIGMVDFFEAVTHQRPQRGPVTPHEGMRMLLDLREAIFHEDLLKTFVHEFSVFPVFSVVRLNTGQIGQVIRTNLEWPLRPVVRVFFGQDGHLMSKPEEIDLSENNRVFIVQDISDRVFLDRYFKLEEWEVRDAEGIGSPHVDARYDTAS